MYNFLKIKLYFGILVDSCERNNTEKPYVPCCPSGNISQNYGKYLSQDTGIDTSHPPRSVPCLTNNLNWLQTFKKKEILQDLSGFCLLLSSQMTRRPQKQILRGFSPGSLLRAVCSGSGEGAGEGKRPAEVGGGGAIPTRGGSAQPCWGLWRQSRTLHCPELRPTPTADKGRGSRYLSPSPHLLLAEGCSRAGGEGAVDSPALPAPLSQKRRHRVTWSSPGAERCRRWPLVDKAACSVGPEGGGGGSGSAARTPVPGPTTGPGVGRCPVDGAGGWSECVSARAQARGRWALSRQQPPLGRGARLARVLTVLPQ